MFNSFISISFLERDLHLLVHRAYLQLFALGPLLVWEGELMEIQD